MTKEAAMRGLMLFGTLVFLMATSAAAQDGNPAGMEPGTNINAADRVFAIAITQGGMAEVKLGELAERSGQSDTVKAFAKQMVSDHSQANDKFADLARKQGLNLPKEIDPEHQAMSQKLEDLRGRKFDTEYMMAQVADHQKTAQLLEYEIGSGQNTTVKDFASDALPIVLRHLKMAQGVMAQLTGQAVR
jgi:putative membrane protein